MKHLLSLHRLQLAAACAAELRNGLQCRERTEIMPTNVSADDPYYCGFSARVPNFVKQGKQKVPPPGASGDKASQQPQPQHGGSGRDRDGGREGARPRDGGPKYREPGVLAGTKGAQAAQAVTGGNGNRTPSGPGAGALSHIPQVQPFWWHSRLYPTDVNAGNWRRLLNRGLTKLHRNNLSFNGGLIQQPPWRSNLLKHVFGVNLSPHNLSPDF